MEGRNIRLYDAEIKAIEDFGKAFGKKGFDEALTEFFALTDAITKGKKRGLHLAFIDSKDKVVTRMKI